MSEKFIENLYGLFYYKKYESRTAKISLSDFKITARHCMVLIVVHKKRLRYPDRKEWLIRDIPAVNHS